MAYMNQEMKSKIAVELKKVVPAGWKYSLAVRNHSTLVFTLRQAPVDILGNIRAAIEAKQDSYGSKSVEVGTSWTVNPYYIETQFSGDVLATMLKISEALNNGNWDKSDVQSDYFNVGWYVDISIGSWNDPFLDTVPAPARIKTAPKGYLEKKLSFLTYEEFLPPNWKTLSPGKKAYATKQAMRMAQESKGS
jgi:hypothetical protein